MKKNNIVLWIASFVVAFLTIYLSNLLDNNYPVTGTFGIEGKKVSYRFEKVHYGDEDFSIVLRADIDGVSGNLFWMSKLDKIWSSSELKESKSSLQGKLKSLKPNKTIRYFVELNYKDKKYLLPDNQKVDLIFYGKIPTAVNVLQYLLLYLGLLLAVRTGLEYFNDSEKSKKFGVLVVVVFLTLTALINPLYLTYKFGYMNSTIPAISNLFPTGYLLITVLWIVSLIIMFGSKKLKVTSLVSAIITIIIFAVMI
jgi:hypothetical protein